MGDTKQPTPIDADLYDRFVRYVEDRHGQRRGVLRDELENAIRQYIDADRPTDEIARLENDVATIQAQLSRLEDAVVVDCDGGTDTTRTVSRPSHTHTGQTARVDPDGTSDASVGDCDAGTDDADDSTDDGGSDFDPDDVPHAKAPKRDKAEYIAEYLLRTTDDAVAVPRAVLTNIIDDRWSFGDRARESLIERVVDKYNAVVAKPADTGDGSAWKIVIGRTEDAVDAEVADIGDRVKQTTYRKARDGGAFSNQ
jgi:hypothetical protein